MKAVCTITTVTAAKARRPSKHGKWRGRTGSWRAPRRRRAGTGDPAASGPAEGPGAGPTSIASGARPPSTPGSAPSPRGTVAPASGGGPATAGLGAATAGGPGTAAALRSGRASPRSALATPSSPVTAPLRSPDRHGAVPPSPRPPRARQRHRRAAGWRLPAGTLGPGPQNGRPHYLAADEPGAVTDRQWFRSRSALTSHLAAGTPARYSPSTGRRTSPV